MLKYDETADLSIIITKPKIKPKSHSESKTKIISRQDRSKTSSWYRSLPNRKNKNIYS